MGKICLFALSVIDREILKGGGSLCPPLLFRNASSIRDLSKEDELDKIE